MPNGCAAKKHKLQLVTTTPILSLYIKLYNGWPSINQLLKNVA
jgi:hypothetical protein